MQSIIFPSGILFVKEDSGHDGVYVWHESTSLGDLPPLPALIVPMAIPPTNMRVVPCPRCGEPSHFWALHNQLANQCMQCWHRFAVLTVSMEAWPRVKPYLHKDNPWFHKSYKEVIPQYVGAPLFDEIDENPDSQNTSNRVNITTGSGTTSNGVILVQDAAGRIAWL